MASGVGIFVSFDFDHDDSLRGSFLAQAKQHCPYKVVNWSLPGAVDGKWTKDAKKRMARADIVVFICGVNTHSAPGVEAEMSLCQGLGKPYILLKGRPGRTCSRPRNASRSKCIHPWRWKRLNESFERCIDGRSQSHKRTR